MKIYDGRPVKPMKPVLRIAQLGYGDLFYRENYPKTIWMVIDKYKAVNLKEVLAYTMDNDEIVKRVKGHLVVEEVEE